MKKLSAELTPMRSLVVHFYGTVIGSIILIGIFVFIRDFAAMEETTEKVRTIGLITACIASFIFFLLALRFYKRGLIEANEYGLPIKERFTKYSAGIVRYTMLCEVGAMLSAIAYFVTGNVLCLVPAGIMIALMFLKVPSKSRIFNDLNPDPKEQMELI